MQGRALSGPPTMSPSPVAASKLLMCPRKNDSPRAVVGVPLAGVGFGAHPRGASATRFCPAFGGALSALFRGGWSRSNPGGANADEAYVLRGKQSQHALLYSSVPAVCMTTSTYQCIRGQFHRTVTRDTGARVPPRDAPRYIYDARELDYPNLCITRIVGEPGSPNQ